MNFLMFHNYSRNQMLIEVYGLGGDKARLLWEFPEHRIHNSELSTIKYQWPEAKEVDYPVEHITCHKDGTFHIKTLQEKTVYIHRVKHIEPIHPDTGIFLDFKVISDLAKKYVIHNDPVASHVSFDVPSDHALCLEGSFSGVNYALEREVGGRLLSRTTAESIAFPARILSSGTIKGMFMGSTKPIPEESMRTKPDGTFITFKFPDGETHSVIKAFMFT